MFKVERTIRVIELAKDEIADKLGA